MHRGNEQRFCDVSAPISCTRPGSWGPTRPARHYGPIHFSKAFPAFDAKTASTASQLKLLYVACGTQDRLISGSRDFREYLKSKNITPTAVETAGAHTWMVWRRNLIEIAPMLF